MPGNKSRKARRESFLAKAAEMYDELEGWYESHPETSWGEIEAAARQRRRELMGSALSELVNGRESGYQLEKIKCQGCGEELKFEGYRGKTIVGLEGDSRLERAYYRCPKCGTGGLFPPGREIEAAGRSVE